MAKKPQPGSAPFPTKADIIRFVEESTGLVGKREIARAFHVRGDDRTRLKDLLREMAREGLLERGHRRSVKPSGGLPNVTVVEIVSQDMDGELLARPAKWTDRKTEPPKIIVAPGKPAGNLGPGDRVLARLERQDGYYEAKILKKLEAARDRVLGVYRREGRVVPTDKRERHEYVVDEGDSAGAKHGELVLVEVRAISARMAASASRSAAVTGSKSDSRLLSIVPVARK